MKTKRSRSVSWSIEEMEAAGRGYGRGGVGRKWGLTYGNKQKKACMSAHLSVEVIIVS